MRRCTTRRGWRVVEHPTARDRRGRGGSRGSPPVRDAGIASPRGGGARGGVIEGGPRSRRRRRRRAATGIPAGGGGGRSHLFVLSLAEEFGFGRGRCDNIIRSIVLLLFALLFFLVLVLVLFLNAPSFVLE